MKIEVDVHTHSIASGHAYSTVEEMARAARKRGLKAFVLTDHGPGMAGGTHAYHFGNQRVLPERIHGVRIFRGMETNILDGAGRVDLEPPYLECLDFVLAGLHEICFEPKSQEGNTRALIAALENPHVDAISHPGNPAYPVDYRELGAAAHRLGKALEINDSSFRVRKGSHGNCARIAELCADLDVRIVIGSDAHWSGDVGRLETAAKLAKESGISKEQVINHSLASFTEYLQEKRLRLAAAGMPSKA